MRCLNANELLSSKVTVIYKTLKIFQLKDIYNLEVSKTLSYLLRLTFVLNSSQMFNRTIQDKLKLDNLLYQKQVQTQVLK